MSELTLKDLNKYKSYPIPKLIKLAEKNFNRFIRERDFGKPCISCGKSGKILQAGHYYKVQICSLRFHEYNVNGECEYCNCWDIDHLIGYRKGLIERYGENHIKLLDTMYDTYKRDGFKWSKVDLIETIVKYR